MHSADPAKFFRQPTAQFLRSVRLSDRNQSCWTFLKKEVFSLKQLSFREPPSVLRPNADTEHPPAPAVVGV